MKIDIQEARHLRNEGIIEFKLPLLRKFTMNMVVAGYLYILIGISCKYINGLLKPTMFMLDLPGKARS